MFQTWGRFRSLANAHRNGGSHRTGAPGPAPIGRHGTPPRNFTPSQTPNTTSANTARVTTGRARERATDARRTDARSGCSTVVAMDLARHRLIGDVERRVDDLEPVRELLLGDAQRRGRVERGVWGQPVHAAVAGGPSDGLPLF